MQTCVPVEKRSKREQRAAVRAHRAAWRGIKLCPRIMRKKTDYSFSDSTMNWYYYGYATIDDLYSAAVTRNIEKYNHQDNVSA